MNKRCLCVSEEPVLKSGDTNSSCREPALILNQIPADRNASAVQQLLQIDLLCGGDMNPTLVGTNGFGNCVNCVYFPNVWESLWRAALTP